MLEFIGEFVELVFAILYFFVAVTFAVIVDLFLLIRRVFYCMRHLYPYYTLEELNSLLNYNDRQDYKLVYSKNDFHIIKTVKIDKEWWEPKYRLFYITKECIKG